MEDLDSVVAGVGHGDPAGGAEGDAGRPVELPAARAARSKLKGERAVGVEDLDSVVEPVGHGDLAGGAEGDAVRPAKLPAAGAQRAELEGERAVGRRSGGAMLPKLERKVAA